MASSQTHQNTRSHSENFQLGYFAIGECHPIKVTVEDTSLSSLALKSDISIRASIQYQYSFETNWYVDWSGFYASGPEILGYLNRVVEKYKLMPHIKLQHELAQASIRRDGDRDTEIEDTTYLLFMGVVSAQWDVTEEGEWEEYVKDWGDKAVGIIGNSLVKSIVNYTLSKTWIGEPLFLCIILELPGRDPGSDDCLYSEKDREAFRDKKYYKEFRHKIEADLNSFHNSPSAVIVLHPVPTTWKLYARKIRHSRRHQSHASHLQGIELEDGSAEHIDVLVCAVGFNVSYRFPFTVLRRDGLALGAHWAATGGVEAYLSIAVDDFPNLFVGGGPNSAVNSGSVTCYI
ncbi:hypothetical protein B0F90DRAFT_1929333 [Multifurca ochricompacta]|uniref:Uncharacterized protein n=1 Tax=Multifurca ochricompacta TaxID=376703 RepID=A0AAD4LW70_9AGAM|nr:hypothetical protein B0F90DRAFT_1929333 [Multifurca ochricompacta]